MKVLVTGGTGLLGKHLLEVLPIETLANSIGTWFTNQHHTKQLKQMDMNNIHQVRYVFESVNPDIVIHTAGIGSVEYAEKFYTEASNTIVEGTKLLHKTAQDYDARFVYISSNAVYDGRNPPYSETSKQEPVNRYGSIKKQAERAVKDGKNWLIIRPFMLYGYPYPTGRKNWYGLIYNSLIDKKPLKLVDDIYWQPTQAKDAAKVIWQLAQESDSEQDYNIAPDEKPMTLYKFGCKIAKAWGLENDCLEPVPSDYFDTIAPRPVNTQYDVGKIKGMGIKMLKVKKGVKELI